MAVLPSLLMDARRDEKMIMLEALAVFERSRGKAIDAGEGDNGVRRQRPHVGTT